MNLLRARVRRPWRLAAEVSALLIAVVVAFPLYWMVLSAFKPAGEIESSEPRPWTLTPSLDSFRRVLEQSGIRPLLSQQPDRGGCVVIASALIAFLAATAVTRVPLPVPDHPADHVPGGPDGARGGAHDPAVLPHARLRPSSGTRWARWSCSTSRSRCPSRSGCCGASSPAVPEALRGGARCIDGASRTRFLWQILFPLVAPGSRWPPASSPSSRPGTTSCSPSRSSSATPPRTRRCRWRCWSSTSRTITDWGGGHGRVHGDDDPGAGVLRTRTTTAGLRPGRRGEGLTT